MPIDDVSKPPILGRPVVAHRKAELVGLPRRLAIRGERSDGGRGATLHLLAHPGVCHRKPTVVEDEVADEAVHELEDLPAELRGLLLELRERLRQSVRHVHVPSPKRPDKLILVIAGNAQRRSRSNHAHDEAEHGGRVRSSVDEVPQEHRPSPLGVSWGRAFVRYLVAELLEQREQLVVAAVDVADDVEGSVIGAAVGP